MFHTNKMPKIIVFRVVIEGTAPTEGPPSASLPIQPQEAPFLFRAPEHVPPVRSHEPSCPSAQEP